MSCNDLRWRALIESIKRKRCILLLGPQASFDPDDSDQLPLEIRLAHYLADQAVFSNHQRAIVNRDDITHVAQLFQQKRDRLELELAVEAFYANFQDKTTAFHRDMAALPFTLCIKITPDNFFCNALKDAAKNPIHDYYHFKRARPLTAVQTNADQPYVYDLYGHFNDLESLLLTEDDLLEFIVNVIKGCPELPPFIRSQFANPENNFLFVGFGFRSWQNRILLHTLNAQHHRNQSFAIENRQFFEHPDFSQIAVFYTQHHKIKFEQLSPLTFAKELREAYTSLAEAAPAVQQPQEKAPKVFLCHASENQVQVMDLGLQLQQAGIDPWQDIQKLRGGDNWDRQLVHVIEKIVDYVIVIQTPEMIGKIESYFYKEIATALERQKKFAVGTRFIVPVALSSKCILPQLQGLHYISLDKTDGLLRLIETIQADWQERRKHIAA